MKLQVKFTLGFVGLVLVCVGISSALINWDVQAGFRQFVAERRLLQSGQLMPFPPELPNGQTRSGILSGSGQYGRNPPVPRNRSVDWEAPENRFNATIQNALLISALFSVILAVILGYAISQWFLGRIRNLQMAMANYRENEIPHKIPNAGNDELDELIAVYNRMIERIAEQERIRKDFFVDMSHEIRTPITSIKGYLEGLLDGVFEPTNEVLKKTLSETDRLGLLVKEMFALAKIESGQVELERENVDLREITAEILESSEKKQQAKELEITVQGKAKTIADRSKCKQILINLIHNAIAYAPAKTAVRIEMAEKKEGTVWRIRNRAPNVDADTVPQLFERFYRSDKSRAYSEKHPHLGIGLNIVRKLTELQGGTVRAEHDGTDITFEVVFRA